MNRRGFLASCLALAAAPAIVCASSLMRTRAVHPLYVAAADAMWPNAVSYVTLFTPEVRSPSGLLLVGFREYARVALEEPCQALSIEDGRIRTL